MVASKTCTQCRLRKLKCDGAAPPCGPCGRARQSLDCVYDDKKPTFRKRQNPLRKGEACLPCRRKKKGCNAVRPCCKTCQIANKEHECIYEDVLPTSAQPVPPKFREFRHFHHKDNFGEEQCCSVEDNQSSSVTLTVASPTTGSPPPMLLGEFFPPTASLSYFALQPQAPIPHEPNIDVSYFSRLSLTDIHDPLAFAVSSVSLNDLNMNFRIISLAHRLQFGFYFSFATQQAILLGDMSHTFIHPFYIHFAEMAGCHLYQERCADFSLLHIEAMHAQLVFEALVSMKEEDDPFQLARAYFLLSMGCLYTRNIPIGKRYLKRAFEIVNRNNIRFVPLSTPNMDHSPPPIPEFSEDVHERAAFLCQMIYSEFDLQLVVGDPVEFCFDLEDQFRNVLHDAYPILFQICPVALRAKTILQVNDANKLMALFHQQTSPTMSWLFECQTFLSSLERHSNNLASRLIEFARIQDHDSCVSLRHSSIICLTALAEMYNLLAHHPLASSTSSGFQDKCSDALRSIVILTEGLSQNDLSFLDPFVGICWLHAIKLSKRDKSKPRHTTNTSSLGQTTQDAIEKSIAMMSQFKAKLDATICLTPSGPGSFCSQLAHHRTHRRQPGTPDFLQEEVRLAYGL